MRTYPSKLLLFGEHVLLLGNTALAIPVPLFSGKWVEKDIKANEVLHLKLAQFARSEVLQQMDMIDHKAFCGAVQNGLTFESNIPMGYGLGSSGALCAATYDRFCLHKTSDPADLKVIFAQMESFFHGSSSGIDPLTSYLNRPVLIRNKITVDIIDDGPGQTGMPIVFLIDSGLPRQTGTLVRWFLGKCAETAFYTKLEEQYLPAHEQMLQSWLDSDAAVFWSNLRQVSRFQLENFDPMIPTSLHNIWLENIDNQDIVFKICGAGGGGFMLGFCKNKGALDTLKQQFKLVFPCSV